MIKISIPYGTTTQEAVLDDGYSVQIIDPVCEAVACPVEGLIEDALEHPIGSRKLEEMVTKDTRVTIIVNDNTRPGPSAEIVDALVKRLNRCHIPDRQLQFVVATGSHRASTPGELKRILGETYYKRIAVRNHDCMDGDHVYMGETESGLPIWIDRAVAEAEFIITTGLIVPHHSAGFSGGRKSIVPGVAGIDTLKIHHSLPIRPFEPSMGFMEENPFHLAALEAAKKTKVRFCINIVQDAHKQNIACVAGDLQKAHECGVAISRQVSTVEVDRLADIVVVSPGGFPRDSDLYQAQKALAVGEVFGKKKGCTFILCARAEEGIGEGLFRQWLTQADTPEEVIERFQKEGFNPGNNKAFMYARALTKGKVVIVSDQLQQSEVNEMMLELAPTLQQALDEACEGNTSKNIVVLPKAVNIIPKIKNGEK